MQIPSVVATLLVFWYALNARNAMEREKREAALDEREAALNKREAALDRRRAKLDTRRAQLDELRASNKEYVRTHREKFREEKARLEHWDKQLVIKFNLMQKVSRTFKELVDSFTCGITQEVFIDPVMLINGQTYSKKAIETWFLNHETCPNTRDQVWTRFYPNYAMKSSISAMKEAWFAIKEFREVMKPKAPAIEPAAVDAPVAEAAVAEDDAAEAGAAKA
jgi:hypothetical protein